MRYSAFISYSHSDARWARWLQTRLERYRIPKQYADRDVADPRRARLLPIFRDRDDLPSAASLTSAIERALADAAFLIVICSPRSAKSAYVEREIEYFKSLGREHQILCFVIEGDYTRSPGSQTCCLSPALFVQDDGQVSEPLAADVRQTADGPRLAFLKVVAGILQVDLDRIRQRDQERRRRATRTGVAAASGSLLVAALMYVGLADMGVNLAGSGTICRWLDRYSLSQFRVIHSDKLISQQAAKARSQWAKQVWSSQHPDRRFPHELHGDLSKVDNWTTTQVLAALCRMTETTVDDRTRLFESFDRMFERNAFVVDGDRPLGWPKVPGGTPQVAIGAWMACALAHAHRRSDVFSTGDRSQLEKWFTLTTRALDEYSANNPGEWHMCPDTTGSTQGISYGAILILQAANAAKKSKLHWSGAPGRTEDVMQRTAEWLIATYDSTALTPGWRRWRFDPSFQTFDGLTIQGYCTLLDAELLDGPKIPDDMFDSLTTHLISCGNRSSSFPLTMAEFEVEVLNNGTAKPIGEAVTFLWYPWTLEACQLWLDRASRIPQESENTVGIRRTISDLMSGPDRGLPEAEQALFRHAESLYGVSAIPSLQQVSAEMRQR